MINKKTLMAKIWFLSILIVCVSSGAMAADSELQQVSPHVWAYVNAKDFSPAASFGANAGVIVGEKYAMVVDTLISQKQGERLLADIRKITKLPIRFVVNTHYHLDHAWGNSAFEDEDAQFIGGAGAAELAKTEGKKGLKSYKEYGLTSSQMRGTEIIPAQLSLEKPQMFDLGGVSVQVIPQPHGHCADNLIVWVTEDKTLFSGDLMFAACHPFMGEGDIAGWVQGLDFILGSGAEKIIPGHGPICTLKDVEQMKTYVLVFDKLATELCAGKTQADAKTLAEEMLKKLPAQGRENMPGMVETNLRMKYLPPAPQAK